MAFHRNILTIDCDVEADRACEFIRQQVAANKREGAVVGVSGGVDSAVASAMCVRALGADRVLCVALPERESSLDSAKFALKHARQIGVRTIIDDITATLEGFGAYRKRDVVIKKLFPEFTSRHRSKIALPADLLSRDAFNVFSLKIEDGKGNVRSVRLDAQALQAIVAASNVKQRARMMYLYYYAEKENYLVCGTTNKSEDIQGFFVKYGDGGVDIEPLAHLYKVQIYQMAEYLGVTKEIIDRVPTPDTYSFSQSDEEFYFRMPYATLDLLLYAWENRSPVKEVCEAMGLTEVQVKRAFRDFNAKASATRHLHSMPPAPTAYAPADRLAVV